MPRIIAGPTVISPHRGSTECHAGPISVTKGAQSRAGVQEPRRAALPAARGPSYRGAPVLPTSVAAAPTSPPSDVPAREASTRMGSTSTAGRGRGCDLRLPGGEPPPRRASRDVRRVAGRGGHGSCGASGPTSLLLDVGAAGRLGLRLLPPHPRRPPRRPRRRHHLPDLARRGAGPHPRLPARGGRLHRQALLLPGAAGARQRPRTRGSAGGGARRSRRGRSSSTSRRAARSCPASG